MDTMTPEQQADFDALMAKIHAELKDNEKWMVASGDQVSMGVHGKYVVSTLILGKELEEKIDKDRRIWKLFSLMELSSGTNWAYPIPAMSEGRADIRQLLDVGGARIKSLTFLKGEDHTKRVFQAVEHDGFEFKVTVTSTRIYA